MVDNVKELEARLLFEQEKLAIYKQEAAQATKVIASLHKQLRGRFNIAGIIDHIKHLDWVLHFSDGNTIRCDMGYDDDANLMELVNAFAGNSSHYGTSVSLNSTLYLSIYDSSCSIHANMARIEFANAIKPFGLKVDTSYVEEETTAILKAVGIIHGR